tara:strand:- start:369 stop:482 length:114 start_codon:yes stop_codon:yes gene_type:complete
MEKYDNDNDKELDELKTIEATPHDSTQVMNDDGSAAE